MMVKALCAAVMCLFMAWGETVFAQSNLTPVRRTTIVTADIETSLAFYRDTLGFDVEYDQIVTDPDTLALLAPGANEGRAITLRYGETLGGSVGLFWTPGLPTQSACAIPALPGSVSLLLLTDNLDAIRARLDTAGVAGIIKGASYDESRGPVDVYAVFDPNCVRVTIAQIERESLLESLEK